MCVYLVRHGQTISNLNDIVQGQSESDLTELGCRQAEGTRDRLKPVHFDRIITSDLRRAVQTAEIIAQDRNLEIKRESLLREQHWGDYQGKKMSVVLPEWKYDKPEHYIDPPGGETLADLADRAREFWRLHEAGFEGKATLIVSHGTFLGVLLLAVLGDSIPPEHPRNPLPNGSITLLKKNPGATAWNVTYDVVG